MANRRFEMFEYRQVLTRMRLGDTDRAIARVGLMGRRKVARLRRTAEAAGWLDVATPLPGDPELSVHLGSVRTQPAVASLAEPHRERITRWWRQGVQGTTIHGALVRSHGFTGSYSSVRRFLAGVEAAHPQVTTVLEFDPGEAAQVDFGKGPEVLDARTGELLSTWIFIMTLVWSRHGYAEVVTDQKVATWLGCHRRAFEWFNGVPGRLTIDNPKCAITRACYHDPEVQRAYAECAEGYGFKIEPCPVRDPKKKAKVEVGVQIVERWILAALRHRTFFSLAELNHAIAERLEWLNARAFRKLPGSRRTAFESIDRPALRALPAEPYVFAQWKKVRVHVDYHIELERHYHSVPHALVGRELHARFTDHTVELFHRGQRVASHVRSHHRGRHTTVAEHMPEKHRRFAEQWSPERFSRWAEKIGPATGALITEVLHARRHPEQCYRSCLGILRLAKTYSDARLEAAAQRALTLGAHSVRSVESILKHRLDEQPLHEAPECPLPDDHDNLRGPSYFH